MRSTHSTIDWHEVKRRVAGNQSPLDEAEHTDPAKLARVFRERAVRLADRNRTADKTVAKTPVLVFQVAGERFGIALANLEQVYPKSPITPVPGAADYLLGVANLQGIVRSVVDPIRLLHLPECTTDQGYFVLVRLQERYVALWVAQLEGVSHIDLTALAPVDRPSTGGHPSLVEGVTEDRMMVLNLKELFAQIS